MPERVSISALTAALTVESLVSPAAVQEKLVSEDTGELAVIVNVTSFPSATLFVSLVKEKVGESNITKVWALQRRRKPRSTSKV